MFTRKLISAVCIFQMSFAPLAFAGDKPSAPGKEPCTSDMDGRGEVGKCHGWDPSKGIIHHPAALKADGVNQEAGEIYAEAEKAHANGVICAMYARYKECIQDDALTDPYWLNRMHLLLSKETEAAVPCNPPCNTQSPQVAPLQAAGAAAAEQPPPAEVPPVQQAPPPPPTEKVIKVIVEKPAPMPDQQGNNNGTGNFFSNPQSLMTTMMIMGLLSSLMNNRPQGPSPFGMPMLGQPPMGSMFGQPRFPMQYGAPGGAFGSPFGQYTGLQGGIPSFVNGAGGMGSPIYNGGSGFGAIGTGGAPAVLPYLGSGGSTGYNYSAGSSNVFPAQFPVTAPSVLPYL